MAGQREASGDDRPLAPPGEHEAPSGLDARVAEALALARQAHPGVEVPAAAFAAYLAERGFGGEGANAAHAADLYLCCACLRRDVRAIAVFDAALVAAVEPALARMGLEREARDETAQALREKLFVGGAGPAKLAEYAGRGPLGGWLRAAAVRTALNALRGRPRADALDEDAWLAWPSPADDPEIASLKRACGADFRAAFAEALAALEPRTRLLLRQHLLDGLGTEQLGALYKVHPATAYRWLRDARSSLVKATRARLASARRLRADELDSLLRLLESQLDVSVSRLLGEGLERARGAEEGARNDQGRVSGRRRRVCSGPRKKNAIADRPRCHPFVRPARPRLVGCPRAAPSLHPRSTEPAPQAPSAARPCFPHHPLFAPGRAPRAARRAPFRKASFHAFTRYFSSPDAPSWRALCACDRRCRPTVDGRPRAADRAPPAADARDLTPGPPGWRARMDARHHGRPRCLADRLRRRRRR